MLLAADVGGTKTLIGLFAATGARPRPVVQRTYATVAFDSFGALLDQFAADVGPLSVSAAAAGVAGPVIGARATVTNVGWEVSARQVAERLGIARAAVLNDLEAMATSVEALEPSEIVTLQEGSPNPNGDAVVMAAGTGLGVAFLHRMAGRFTVVATETGHADFAARTDAELELVRRLRDRFGRATVEHVLSGQGLVHLHRLTHSKSGCPAVPDLEAATAPGLVSQAGLDRRCDACVAALAMFVDAYGAEAGNVALRTLATSGIYIGGGIAPKILPALLDGGFMRAFLDKAPMQRIVEAIPVRVILNQEAGLLGAALAASRL